MGSPSLKCLFAFRKKLVALIDGGDARNRAGLVIQNLVGHVRCDAQSRHPGNTGSPQIMKSPSRHP